MGKVLKKYLRLSVYLIIPLTTVLLCRGLEIAQGEKNEEIVFGLMVGVFLDLVYGIALMVFDKFKRQSL